MKQVVVAGIVVVGLLAAGWAKADQQAIEYRQAVFQSIGGHMTALVRIVRREVPHTDDLSVHAAGIARLAPLTQHIFPEGSGDGRTDALPAIWRDPDGFDRRRQTFIEAAERLRDAAGGPMGDFVPAFQRLGNACQGCHDNYRAD